MAWRDRFCVTAAAVEDTAPLLSPAWTTTACSSLVEVRGGHDDDDSTSASSSSSCSTRVSSCNGAGQECVAVLPPEVSVVPNNVCVENSTNVHFGNNTFVSGSVVNIRVSENRPDNGDVGSGGEVTDGSANGKGRGIKRFMRWPCVVFSVVMLVVLAGLIAATVVLMQPSIELLPGGIRFANRAFWHARTPTDELDHLETPVGLVIVSHTGTEPCFWPAECCDRVYKMQFYHEDSKKWFDVAYNFLVSGDGVVYEGRGWDAVGAVVKGWNQKALNLALIGTFNETLPSEAQRDQLLKLIAWGKDLGKISSAAYKIGGACQYTNTKSPGFTFMEELKTWEHWDHFVNNSKWCER